MALLCIALLYPLYICLYLINRHNGPSIITLNTLCPCNLCSSPSVIAHVSAPYLLHQQDSQSLKPSPKDNTRSYFCNLKGAFHNLYIKGFSFPLYIIHSTRSAPPPAYNIKMHVPLLSRTWMSLMLPAMHSDKKSTPSCACSSIT